MIYFLRNLNQKKKTQIKQNKDLQFQRKKICGCQMGRDGGMNEINEGN